MSNYAGGFADMPIDGGQTSVPQTMVDAILLAMSQMTSPGVVSVTIDGISTTYSWAQAKDQLLFWERRAARLAGTRRFVNTIDLRNG